MTFAHPQLRSYVDRVLRLKGEQDDLAADIKEAYAEAKASGFDKTIMGQLVAFLRKREKDPHKVEENGAIFDLYLHAYDNGTPLATRAHAHEADDPRGEYVEGLGWVKDGKIEKYEGGPIVATDIGIPISLPPHDEDGVIIEPASAPSDAEAGLLGMDREPPQSEFARRGNASVKESVTAGETATSFSSLNDFSGIGSARETSAMLHPGVVGGPTASPEGQDSGDSRERPAPLSNSAAGAAEQGLGTAPTSVPGPDLSQSGGALTPDAPVEPPARDPAPGAPHSGEMPDLPAIFDRRSKAA